MRALATVSFVAVLGFGCGTKHNGHGTDGNGSGSGDDHRKSVRA